MRAMRVIAATASLLVAAAALAGSPVGTIPVRVERAEFAVIADPASAAQRAAEAPPPDARWEQVRIPHRWRRADNRALALAWYRIEVALPEGAPDDVALYLPRLGNGATIFVNGVLAASIQGPDERVQVRWGQPHLLSIAPRLFRRGANEITLRTVTRDSQNGLSEMLIGSAAQLRPIYRQRELLVYDAAEISAASTAIMGTFMLGIWWFRREEPLYLYFGVGCLSWAARTLPFIVQVVPFDLWWAWRAFYYLATGVFTMAMGAFFLEHARVGHRRWNFAMIGYAVLGPLVVLASGGRLEDAVLGYWQGILFAFMAYALWRFWIALRRRPSIEGVLLGAAVAIAVVFAAIDFASALGLFSYTRTFRLHLAAPVLLVAMGAILATRFVRALRASERVNAELAQKVSEKERELEQQYERLREFERRNAASGERQRIMQDIHDGLGSQLVSSLMLVEGGRTGPDQIATVLREAIDDMRLAIDGLGPEDAELASALANLRYRMEPRLRAAGIELDWRGAPGPESARMSPHAALQVLRLVQEALSNAVRHSGATRIVVDIDHDPGVLRVEVADDGRGFDDATVRPGKGLSNMRRRVREVGAELELRSGASGTTVSLRVPVDRAAPGAGSR